MCIRHEEMLMVAEGGKNGKDPLPITQVIPCGSVKSQQRRIRQAENCRHCCGRTPAPAARATLARAHFVSCWPRARTRRGLLRVAQASSRNLPEHSAASDNSAAPVHFAGDRPSSSPRPGPTPCSPPPHGSTRPPEKVRSGPVAHSKPQSSPSLFRPPFELARDRQRFPPGSRKDRARRSHSQPVPAPPDLGESATDPTSPGPAPTGGSAPPMGLRELLYARREFPSARPTRALPLHWEPTPPKSCPAEARLHKGQASSSRPRTRRSNLH